MKSILLFASFLVLSNSFSQVEKRIYLNEDFDTCSVEYARFYVEIKPTQSDQRVAKYFYKLDGSLSQVSTFLNDSLNELDGPFYTFHANGQLKDSMLYVGDELNGIYCKYYATGQLKAKGNYLEDEFHDSLFTFYPSGNKKRIDIYDAGKLIQGSIYDEQGKKLPYEDYHVEAVYPGGKEAMMRFIMNTVIYPQDAITYGIEGKVYIQFIVDTLGKVQDLKIVRSISPLLSDAAAEVIEQMPKWIPARIDGENYNSYFRLPINFALDGTSTKVNKRLLTNLFWTKKDKLIDPIDNHKIDVNKKGQTTIYYKPSDTDKIISASLTVKELEALRCLKFASGEACNEWYRLFNEQKIEDLKKMGR